MSCSDVLSDAPPGGEDTSGDAASDAARRSASGDAGEGEVAGKSGPSSSAASAGVMWRPASRRASTSSPLSLGVALDTTASASATPPLPATSSRPSVHDCERRGRSGTVTADTSPDVRLAEERAGAVVVAPAATAALRRECCRWWACS